MTSSQGRLYEVWIHFVKNILLILVLGMERKGEREGEKHQCVVAFLATPTGDLTCNPGTCPRLGIQLVTLWFAVLNSIHWTTPAMADYTLETTGLINIHKIFYSAWPGGLDGWVVFQSSTKSLQVRSLHGDTKEAPCWDVYLYLPVSVSLCLPL